MTIKEIQQTCDLINQKLYNEEVAEAFLLINVLSNELQDYNLSCKIVELAAIYKNMLNYKLTDVRADKEQQVYHRFLNDVFAVAQQVKETLFVKLSNRHEYSLIRVLPTLGQYAPDGFTNFEKVPFLLQSHYLSYPINDLKNSDLKPELWNEIIEKHQKILIFLFNYIWLNNTFVAKDLEAIKIILNDKLVGEDIKSIMVSALTLNILRFYDDKKFLSLLSMADNENSLVRQRALVGLMLILSKYGKRMKFQENIINRIKVLCDSPTFVDLTGSVIFQLIRATETEKLTKYIKEDIMPDVIKISPQIVSHIEKMDDEDESDDIIKPKPSMQDIFEEYGLSEKLQEFGEMQMSGSDVYVSTFAQMKNFPFFNVISNWFLPFDKKNPYVSRLFDKKDTLFSVILSNPALCNSDKYSFSLNLLRMGDNELSAMETAIREEKIQMDDVIKDMKTTNSHYDDQVISNQYIQDLYRFYKLYPKHTDFENPLLEILQVADNELFNIIFSEQEQANKIAEYFYTYNFYNQANNLFLQNYNPKNPDSAICRKIGYCYQQKLDYKNALNYYITAESLEKNNTWTLRRMAYCYRKTGNYTQASDCYKTLLENSSEDYKLMFRLAMCYMEDENYDAAVSLFYKINYLMPDYPKIKNVLLWSTFYNGKLQQAKQLIDKIMSENPDTNDFIMAGHIILALDDRQTAVDLYNKSFSLSKNASDFLINFNNHREKLLEFGVKETVISSVIEAVLMSYIKTD
ncbi:MAG: tetratricopeptide repeat protein [Prevotellaceae bacterium]|jgi:tetratricopeptide (TPR) repeat protein|nr:tetratricopeptide repeat protein [Prevotellaceae bacterium]